MTCDISLIKAIRNSDSAAFQTLYLKYYESLYGFIWGRTESIELAKDICQDIFTGLWQNRQGLEIHTSVKAYLYRAAHYSVVSWWRKRNYQQDYFASQTADRNPTTDTAVEMRTSVQIAIENLPEKLRETFVLSRFEGLKYAEIADVLEISSKTVERRISEALRLLRNELAY
jgi:RNA polymerase sigma-70 factor (ECF subfamily)